MLGSFTFERSTTSLSHKLGCISACERQEKNCFFTWSEGTSSLYFVHIWCPSFWPFESFVSCPLKIHDQPSRKFILMYNPPKLTLLFGVELILRKKWVSKSKPFIALFFLSLIKRSCRTWCSRIYHLELVFVAELAEQKIILSCSKR